MAENIPATALITVRLVLMDLLIVIPALYTFGTKILGLLKGRVNLGANHIAVFRLVTQRNRWRCRQPIR